MATENDRFADLECERRKIEEKYVTSRSKIQSIPYTMLEQNKYSKYYCPYLLSFGPIHHRAHPKLERGEAYKLMWASMYAEESQQNPQLLHKKIADNIVKLRGLFSWDEIRLRDGNYGSHYCIDDELAWMLFVDGCAVLQIMKKANLSKPEDLKVKVDIVALVRDLFLLENQLPYEVLELLSEDKLKLKISMYGLCELQNMFTVLESPQSFPIRDPEVLIEILKKSSQPIHLLDFLRSSILSSGMDSVDKDQSQLNVRLLEENLSNECRHEEQIKVNLVDIALTYANKKERYISYRNIQELKTAAIRVKRQKNISLRNISFSSSLFGGQLHLPPLILNASTVSTLLNLVAYEMCPDFKNEFEICSYIKLLDLLIDHPEDVKELRSSGLLHNSLGSDEEVVELLNTIGSGLVHNPALHSGIMAEIQKHYKKRLSIWMADAYSTYFKSPWTITAFMAALIAIVLTAQTWLAFRSK